MHKGPDNRDQPPSHRERELAALANRQHGVVATRQLLALGFDAHAIKRRVAAGRLHRIHRGIYAVGYPKLTPSGYRMAAALAYGPGAVISHGTAAAIWGIGRSPGKIHVTAPRHKRRRRGIVCHAACLHPEDLAMCDGIPVTSVARTILDQAAVLNHERLIRLIEDAIRAELFDMRALDRAVARRPRVRGVKPLRTALADYRGAADTRSGKERDFRALIRRARLPEPQYNVLVAGVLVDVYWPQWKLTVEIDSRGYHMTPWAFERDRVRDAMLQRHGFRVLRVTEKRLRGDAGAIVEDILALRQ